MRRLLIILTTIATALCGMAQRVYSPDFAIGVKGGMTLSQMSFSPSVKQSFTEGYIFGITARYTEENHFGLIAELNIEQRGWKENFEEKNPLFNYDRKLTYIQLPLLTHIFFGSEKARFFINLGPEFGYMLSDKISADFNYHNIASIPDFPRGYRTNEQMAMDVKSRFDYGISAGLGCEIRMKKRHSIMLEGRYYYGLGNIFPASKRDYFSASRGMSIEITLGYMFRIR